MNNQRGVIDAQHKTNSPVSQSGTKAQATSYKYVGSVTEVDRTDGTNRSIYVRRYFLNNAFSLN